MNGKIHSAGQKISDRYEIREYIGEGGMQEVYLARDLLLSREVALKVPKNNSAEKRFQRSAVVSARVNHANVAKTLDYVVDAGRAYLIEEFIEGRDLGRVLKEHFSIFDPLLTSRVFHHLSKGLAASHHAGVVHRDIKPSNVMAVGGEELTDVKITDFGIAKMAEEELAEAIEGGDDSLTASQTAIGALPYMAPEMINSIAEAGMPADIWSVGALAFELMTGKKPFGSGLKAVPAIQAAKVPSVPTNLVSNPQFRPASEELYQIILSCMKADPKERPTADQLVSRCELLCYPTNSREFGTVASVNNAYWGFISADHGRDVFYHINSIFGGGRLAVGDRIWFGRHAGSPNDRAFPVMRVEH